ncbi:unnamed protein product [Litomosoides sigmodontis]|uniref:Uncharacterized protein n=1 Tax=Litomosoides sigmodontis TaxID=42156 RepID=A0A3P6V5D9_LITSI|nr:unnamed protein product [Litomosoides sigmodontis]
MLPGKKANKEESLRGGAFFGCKQADRSQGRCHLRFPKLQGEQWTSLALIPVALASTMSEPFTSCVTALPFLPFF